MIDHVLRAAPSLAAPHRRRSSSAIRRTLLKAALAAHPGLTFVVQEPQLGTAPRAADDASRCCEARRGTLVLLSGDVPLLTANTLQTLVDRHQRDRRGRDGGDRRRRRAVRLRPHRPRPASRLHGSSRRRTRRRPSGAIREINSGIYAFALDGLFDARSRASRPRTRRASTTCPISSRSTGSAGATVETVTVAESGRDSRHQQPRASWQK